MDTVTLKENRGKKCLFLCSGRGDKTLEKLDTLNYTNIQCKASDDLPLSETTLLTQLRAQDFGE